MKLHIDDLTIVKIDMLFEDFKSHTQNIIANGKGALYARSTAQNQGITPKTTRAQCDWRKMAYIQLAKDCVI